FDESELAECIRYSVEQGCVLYAYYSSTRFYFAPKKQNPRDFFIPTQVKVLRSQSSVYFLKDSTCLRAVVESCYRI
nr:hypothetical protein [Tanacetum cinerariifolium]